MLKELFSLEVCVMCGIAKTAGPAPSHGPADDPGLPVTMDPWDRLILIYHPVVFRRTSEYLDIFRRTSDVLQDNFLNHQGAVSYSLVAWPTTPAWPSASLSAHTWPVAFSTAQAWQAKSRSGRGTDAIRMVRLSIAGPNGVVSNMFKKWCHSL